jgi:Flp pilus assembly protein TadD
MGDHAGAVSPLETAIASNPSFAHAHALLAQVLELSGRSDQALVRMRQAVRLGPRSFVAGLSALHFARGEYGPAFEAAERAVATNPRYTFARVLACAAGWFHGEHPRARAHLRALRADHPSFAARSFLTTFGSKGAAPVENIVKALSALEAAA